MSIVVGVDAGGTATKVIAADGDVIAGEFSGGPANVRIAGVDDAADTIARAIRSALSGAEPSAQPVPAGTISLRRCNARSPFDCRVRRLESPTMHTSRFARRSRKMTAWSSSPVRVRLHTPKRAAKSIAAAVTVIW
jgi:hypothetical protein